MSENEPETPDDDAKESADDLESILALGDVFADKARWQEAIQAYQKAIELDPKNATLHNTVGTLYGEIGEASLEEQAYLQAAGLQPELGVAHLNLGMLYEGQGRYHEAILSCEKCIAVTLDEHERREARRIILEIMARNPDNFPPQRWVQVAETNGIVLAEMMADRLRGQGIKAVAWQEGAGNAMGLSIGSLGTGRVMVFENDADAARALLETDATIELDTSDDDVPIDETEWFEADDVPWIEIVEKAALGLVAVTISPIGAALALIASKVFGRDEGA